MTRSQPVDYHDSGVYVSKSLIAAVAVAGALALGWLGNDVVSHVVSGLSGSSRSSEWGSLTSTEAAPVQDEAPHNAAPAPVAPSVSQPPPSNPPVAAGDGATNVYLTIVNAPPGATTTLPTNTNTNTDAPDASGKTEGTTLLAPAATPPATGAAEDGAGNATSAPGEGSLVRVSGPNGQLRARTGRGTRGTPTNLVVGGGAAMAPRAPRSGPASTSAHGPATGILLNLTPQMAATAIGEHIVIAYDGAIVYVGDHGSLTANSGDSSGGSTVAMNADSSTFSSNYDPRMTVPSGSSPAATIASQLASASLLASNPASAIPLDASPLVSAFISYTANRSADIAGFEDHSILTRGTGNVVTYDDSNVFMNRDGKINANTGDTDSAGLNAIATLRSRVSAGPHCDDGCDDESIIQAQAGVFDEGDVAVDGNGNVVWSPDIVPETEAPAAQDCDDPAETNDDGCDDSIPSDNGDDTDAADDESDDGDVSDPAEPAETTEEADSTRPAADNGEEPDRDGFGPGSLVVGGDGIDDLSERVDGNFNVSTYDDSNVVIGGTGDVNAQIGDSDTGGTVTMDTVDSIVSGGNSR